MEVIQSVAGFLNAYDYENITVAGSPIGFTTGKLDKRTAQVDRDAGHARTILLTVDTGDIRATSDGTAPLGTVDGTAVGHLMPQGSVRVFANYQEMKNFRAIRETSTSAVLRVTYYR